MHRWSPLDQGAKILFSHGLIHNWCLTWRGLFCIFFSLNNERYRLYEAVLYVILKCFSQFRSLIFLEWQKNNSLINWAQHARTGDFFSNERLLLRALFWNKTFANASNAALWALDCHEQVDLKFERQPALDTWTSTSAYTKRQKRYIWIDGETFENFKNSNGRLIANSYDNSLVKEHDFHKLMIHRNTQDQRKKLWRNRNYSWRAKQIQPRDLSNWAKRNSTLDCQET